jgi:alpha-L-arabinofuranosidase
MVDPPTSSPWGTLRASYGRKEPFDLDTLEIGNEDNLGSGPASYSYRYTRLTEAITKEFPNHKFEYIATYSGIDNKVALDK